MQQARFAQLVLNKGIWPTAGAGVGTGNGTGTGEKAGTEVIVDPDYIDELMSPQFPARGFSYGLLTWPVVTLNSAAGKGLSVRAPPK